MDFFDSHTHVSLPSFDDDREGVLKRAQEAGVTGMLNVILAPDPQIMFQGFELIEKTKGMFGAVGIHPHDAKLSSPETLNQIRSALERPKIVALGEIGLDYYYDHSPREDQVRCFNDQLDLAIERNVPVVVHCRDAFEETYAAIQKRDVFHRVGGVFHCFTGNATEAERVVKLGGYVSFSGILTFKPAETLRDAARVVPLDRLLIETDAPYLAPTPHRGKRNEPSYVVEVAKTLAHVKGCTLEQMAHATWENAHQLFRL